MKTKDTYQLCIRLVLLAMAGSIGGSIRADDPPPAPLVHILATDPSATEGPILIGPDDIQPLGAVEQNLGADGPIILDTGSFTVRRDGPTNESLTVFYQISGIADNGLDYVELTGEATIPAGRHTTRVDVVPIDDNLSEGTESVVLTLIPTLCLPVEPPPPGCYLVGSPERAVVSIRDNDLPPNQPPKVGLISPPDGSVFLAPTDIRVVAEAEDSDGRVRRVEFFADGVSIGVVTNHPWILDPILGEREAQYLVEAENGIIVPIDPIPIPIHPFAILWENVPPGPHVLTAVATDNDGASSTSDPVHIKVVESPADPIVTVIARDPVAAEGCRDANADCVDTATFIVRRSGGTERPLRVFYRLSGAAVNGTDYVELPNSVVIEAGESHAAVVVEPIDDREVEGSERVVLSLIEPRCLDGEPTDIAIDPNIVARGCYHVGRAHTAGAVIHDNDTPPNSPPVVRMVEPGDGDIFRAPATITLAATAYDLDGQVVHVEFFEGDHSLGVVPTPEILPYAFDASLDPNLRIMLPRYILEWTDVPPGRYVLTAVATDDQGETSITEPVEIQVVGDSLPPVVNIETVDSTAMEQSPYVDALPDTATFLVTRAGGDLSRPLEVFYRVGGSAVNGVDYDELPGRVVIEAGEESVAIEIVPIDDLLCEGRETVRLGLVSHPCIAIFPPPRECYTVGPNSRARAVIDDDDICPPNQPPRVAIVRPSDGDVFRAPADLLVCAEAKDADGRVVKVDFYANDESIGSVRLNSAGEPELFCIKWENVPAGAYELTAVATDNEGVSTTSAPVRIRVIERPLLPVVRIVASDAVAGEDGTPGAFTVSRDCCTTFPLHVRYSLGGTAENGEDYELLSGTVTIPEGSRTARIVVEPIEDELAEGTESVVARLEPALCAALGPLPVDCYRIGHPSRDVVFIRDNDSSENEPPLIAILLPSEGEGFGAPADIPILAVGLDSDGWIPLVELFANDTKIGDVTVNFLVEPPPGQLQTFEFDWNDVPPGAYTLTARATDNRGESNTSGPIRIRVVDPCTVPVVSVHAVDSIATEGGSDEDRTATFVVRRDCGFAEPLAVHYELGGTAKNGVDYVLLSGVAELAPGEESARVVVDPIEDDLPEGVETVVLELVPLSCWEDDPFAEGCYLVGRPNRAVAYIRDNDNQAPKVEVVRPFDGQIFKVPADIDIVVAAVDPDGWVGRIQFLANGDVIAEQVIDFIVPPPPGRKQEFHFTWQDVPVGSYELAARVFDNEGAESESDAVRVEVGELDPPPVVIIDARDGYAREGTTNTAVFVVRRIGDNGDALTVHYSISGTAQNGVDYGAIPYSVEIPAGRSSARIVIVAIEDDEAEDLETVVLRLQMPVAANTLPPYVIGKPDAAAAVIVDAERERPGCRRLPGGMFHLCLPGRDGEGYRILATTDFGEWEEICVGVVIDGAIHFVDPDANLHERRFYVAEPAAVTLEEE